VKSPDPLDDEEDDSYKLKGVTD
jgi:hypothetical protein